MHNNGRLFLAAILVSFGLAACSRTNRAEQRAELAATAKGRIVIGVAWPLSTSQGTLGNGVRLAVDEINKSGGVLGRKIKIIKMNDDRSVSKGIVIAHEFAHNENMVAVIGDLNSYISIPASAVYQSAGMVMISPASSAQRLTHQGFNLVFRTIPNDKSEGTQLAEYAAKRHYKRIAAFYINNIYGFELANFFDKAANKFGIDIVDRRSYDKGATDYIRVLKDWKSLYSFDAIFLAGSLPESATIVRDIRKVGIKVPVFGGDDLSTDQLIRLGGKAVEGMVVASYFAADMRGARVAEFDNRYRSRFGTLPNAYAAGGYDAVELLAHAIRKAGTTVPAKIATVLHETRGWHGVTGIDTFNENGDVVHKAMAFEIVRNGKFQYLPMDKVAPAAHPATNHPG